MLIYIFRTLKNLGPTGMLKPHLDPQKPLFRQTLAQQFVLISLRIKAADCELQKANAEVSAAYKQQESEDDGEGSRKESC